MPMFLDKRDLESLTGSPRRATQRKYLSDNNIPWRPDTNGGIKVLFDDVVIWMHGKAGISSRKKKDDEPNLAALDTIAPKHRSNAAR